MYVVAACVHKQRSIDNQWDFTSYSPPAFFVQAETTEEAKKLVVEILNPTKDRLIEVCAISVRRMP